LNIVFIKHFLSGKDGPDLGFDRGEMLT